MPTDYAARLAVPLSGDDTTRFFTRTGRSFATGYTRVVIGDRGPYVEFDARHLDLGSLEDAGVPHTYYVELRSVHDNVKVYAQLLRVTYADYVPGMFYASPFELYDRSGVPLIVPLPSRCAPKGKGVVS